jgi:hypothetical protein
MKWTGHVARIFVEKPEGKRPLGRPRRRWEGDIKMDLREIGWDDMNWINLAQDSDQSCEHGNEPSGFIKWVGQTLSSLATSGFSRTHSSVPHKFHSGNSRRMEYLSDIRAIPQCITRNRYEMM